MAKAEVTRIYAVKKSGKKYIKDPVIVKIAKLSLILADRETDIETKHLHVMAAVQKGYITEEEATQLMMYRVDLERFGDHEDEDLLA